MAGARVAASNDDVGYKMTKVMSHLLETQAAMAVVREDVAAMKLDIYKIHENMEIILESHTKPDHPQNSNDSHIRMYQESFELVKSMFENINQRLTDIQTIRSTGTIRHDNRNESDRPAEPEYDPELKAQIISLEEKASTAAKEALCYKGRLTRAMVNLEIVHNELETSKQKLQAERLVVSRQFEYILEFLGRIRVMVRIRPLIDAESEEEIQDFGQRVPGELSNSWGRFAIPEEEKSAMGIRRTLRRQYLERIFSPEDTNEDVFREVEMFIQSGLDQSVCIFAYGPSGTGKTYTMTHQQDVNIPSVNDGIIPQTINMVFKHATETSDRYNYTFELSAVEVYLNEFYDLMTSQTTASKIRSGEETYLKISDWQTTTQTISNVLKQRQSGSNRVNARSSRSHLVFHLRVKRTTHDGSTSVRGQINFVDLAGSEKIVASADSKSTKEGIDINESLTDLITMLGQLGRGAPMTPSKALGRMLRPSFENGKVIMMATVSPLKKDYDSLTKPTLSKAEAIHEARPKSRIVKSGVGIAVGATSASTPRRSRHSSSPGILTPNTTPRRSVAGKKGSPSTPTSTTVLGSRRLAIISRGTHRTSK